MSDSVRPHRRQPTRLPHPWDSPGKNTGVGCHFLLQCMKVKSEREVTQSCPTQQPHGLQPTSLLRPWDFPGKSTGVGCHCLLCYSSLDTVLLQRYWLAYILLKVKEKSLSRVRLLATPWTATYQPPPSMGFSRQEYWSGVPSPSPIYIIINLYSDWFIKVATVFLLICIELLVLLI